MSIFARRGTLGSIGTGTGTERPQTSHTGNVHESPPFDGWAVPDEPNSNPSRAPAKPALNEPDWLDEAPKPPLDPSVSRQALSKRNTRTWTSDQKRIQSEKMKARHKLAMEKRLARLAKQDTD